MPLDILVGAQWGDEGKAKVVDVLSKDMDIIVRYQGGANAGHTVVENGRKYVFHLIPSGILHKDKECFIGNGVVFDIDEFFKEIQMLENSGIDYKDRLKISTLAHLIMPYHRKIDSLKESKADKPIGTTGRGIGPCYTDKASRAGIRVIDLFSKNLESKIKANLEFYNFLFSKYYQVEPLKMEDVISQYKTYADKLAPFVADIAYLTNYALDEGKTILAEGAQGVGLDIDFGTYPFVTSSNPIAGGALAGIGVSPLRVNQIYGIVKAYLTRVGEGPFPTELNDSTGEFLRTKGGEFGSTTGRPRRCGWFDLVFSRYSMMINGFTDIVLTKLDVLDGMEKIKVCTAYNYNGEKIEQFPNSMECLSQAQPVYEEFDGWDTVKGIKKYKDLPKNARKYIDYLETQLEVPITMISVGQDREETIIR